jgi:hypothetical protein
MARASRAARRALTNRHQSLAMNEERLILL